MSTARQIVARFKKRKVELKLSADGLNVLVPKGTPPEEFEEVKRERGWILMWLHYQRSADAPDPRLAFLVSGEEGLTQGAIETRMEIAFGMSRDSARVYVTTAMAMGFLVPVDGKLGERIVLEPRGKTASGFVWRSLART